MIVQPLLGTTGFPNKDGESADLEPFVYRVTGISIGEDPTTATGIPIPRQTEITIGDTKYRCDRVRCITIISDGACDVAAYFSTDGRFRFPTQPPNSNEETFLDYDLGYKKVQIEVPGFTKGQRTARDEMGMLVTSDYWYKDYKTIDIEQDVLNVRVNILNITNEDVREIITQIRLQRGRLHQFFDSFWIMQMPFLRSIKQEGISIAYAWVSDPGNSGFGQPANLATGDYVSAPSRGPFELYVVAPASSTQATPRITTQSAFPETINGSPNPLVDLNGWTDLPGRPI